MGLSTHFSSSRHRILYTALAFSPLFTRSISKLSSDSSSEFRQATRSASCLDLQIDRSVVAQLLEEKELLGHLARDLDGVGHSLDGAPDLVGLDWQVLGQEGLEILHVLSPENAMFSVLALMAQNSR